MNQIDWNQARNLVKELKQFTKVYGTFTPRKINGVNAEYSLIIKDNDGQHWHFLTGDLRHGRSYATIRKCKGARDFKGETNQTITTPEQLNKIIKGV